MVSTCGECRYFDKRLLKFMRKSGTKGYCNYYLVCYGRHKKVDGRSMLDSCPRFLQDHDFYEILVGVFGCKLGLTPETERTLGEGRVDVVWWYRPFKDISLSLPFVAWEIERRNYDPKQVTWNAEKILERSEIPPHFFIHVVSKDTYNTLRPVDKRKMEEFREKYRKRWYLTIVDLSKTGFDKIVMDLITKKAFPTRFTPLYSYDLDAIFRKSLEEVKKCREDAGAWRDLRQSMRSGKNYSRWIVCELVERILSSAVEKS